MLYCEGKTEYGGTMGVLRIELSGSFDKAERTFSAEDGGHADAISQAIEWLAATALPRAIEQDHALASDGVKPKKPFGRGRHE